MPETKKTDEKRREWTPPKLDTLDVGETAGGGTAVTDGKGGVGLSS